jgi:small subunit ribosomal protein S18
MARSNDRDRGTKRASKDDRRRGGKKKVCIFCKDKVDWVDYKDVNLLRRFMSDRGKIRARRVTGNCSQHQRDVAIAIKTGRELALLPYLQRTVAERGGGRGGGGRGPRPDRRDEVAAPIDADADVEVDLDLEDVDADVPPDVDVPAVEEAGDDEVVGDDLVSAEVAVGDEGEGEA